MTDALERMVTDVPFTGGMSTKLDKFQIPFNKLAAARDVIFTSPGELRTRYGYKALTTRLGNTNRFGDDFVGDGQGLLSYGNELVMCDPFNLYSYDPAQQKWIYKAPCTSMNIKASDVVQLSTGQRAPDQNIAPNGLRFDAWEDGPTGGGGVYYSVTNATTGTVIIPRTLVHASAVKPKVLQISGRFVLLYIRTDTDLLYLATMPSVNVSVGLTTSAITSGATPNIQLNATYENYDATVITNTAAGALLYVAICNNVAAGAAGVTIYGFAPNNLVTAAYQAIVANLVPRQLTIFADTIGPGSSAINGPVVAFSDGATVQAVGYQWSLAATTMPLTTVQTAADTVVNLTGASSSDLVSGVITQERRLDLYWTVYNATSWKTRINKATLVGATPTVTLVIGLYRSQGLASKAWAVTLSGHTVSYVTTAYQSQFPTAPGFSGLQDTYTVADSSGYMVGRFFYGEAGGLPTYESSGPTRFPMLPEVSASSATLFHVALTQASFLTTVGLVGEPPTSSTMARTTAAPGTQAPLSAVFTQDGVRAISFDFFDTQNSYLSAELGGVLLLGGGLLQSYDGETLTENDFSQSPENIVLTPATVGGAGLTLLATYWYCFVWQWQNARGQVQQSAPSVPISVTLAGSNNSVSAVVPALHLTNKVNVTLMAYRSRVGGTVFQQAISTTVPAASGATNAPILNSRVSETIGFVDVLSDTLLASRPNLYTTGGVIENLPTPPCSDLTVNYNRAIALSSTDDNVLSFSQQNIPGAPVEMSEWLYFNVDPRGGPATAVRALDQHTIVFKESLIMAVDGIGPDATGGQGSFGEAYIVTTDVGCVFPRSIGMGPNGLYFQSAKGLAHIDRALQVTYIGWEAQELVNAHEIVGAQLVHYTQQMRFTLNNKTLVGHDYFVGQWFEHTNVNAVDAAVWLGQYVYLRPDGVVMVENPPTATMTISEAMATYSDAGSFVGLSFESPWFPFGGLNGWARTWWAFVLMKIKSRCRLRVELAYDQDPSIRQTVYMDLGPGGAYGNGIYGDGIYGGQFPSAVRRLQPNQQLSNAVKLTVTVLQIEGVIGESVSLSGFSFEWGQSRTARRPNSSATYG